ncbi:unnamed protein product [Hymenolepis diminuta]|uniref:CathepsinC_exc domain-containing protein n=1 Tax=Hymenolepis diminuta TaxID=6216 RepID=A0A0R3SWM9_HYMDI|nr:unnamed protein product [Hymenolepis diminuta]VUZ48013.1 unnamed protein product [Hymenolepis diminuta]
MAKALLILALWWCLASALPLQSGDGIAGFENSIRPINNSTTEQWDELDTTMEIVTTGEFFDTTTEAAQFTPEEFVGDSACFTNDQPPEINWKIHQHY